MEEPQQKTDIVLLPMTDVIATALEELSNDDAIFWR